jgi:hypothetical protein
VIAVAEMFGISGRRAELVALLERFERQAADGRGCRCYTFAATLADPARCHSTNGSRREPDPGHPKRVMPRHRRLPTVVP